MTATGEGASAPSPIRDRIAAVLLPDLEYASAYNPIEDPQVWAQRLADAVIAELGLTEFRVESPVAERWWSTKVEPITDWGANDE